MKKNLKASEVLFHSYLFLLLLFGDALFKGNMNFLKNIPAYSINYLYTVFQIKKQRESKTRIIMISKKVCAGRFWNIKEQFLEPTLILLHIGMSQLCRMLRSFVPF